MTPITIEDRFVDVPGGRVFVRSWTPEDATTASSLVLLHDSLGCIDLWRDFPGALARSLERPVIAYDRLGFGRSMAREGLPSLDFVKEETDIFFPAIRRKLDLDRFSLFGHSVGGAMALTIAATMGGDVESVVTEAAQTFVEERTREGILAAREGFGSPEQFKKLEKWHGDKAQWVLDAWTEIWLDPEFATWSLDPHLGRIECPVLAIHGESDEFGSTEFPKKIANGVAGSSEVAILEGCGHVPHRERQDDVLRLVSRFLNAGADRCS